jgi:hypothetical protein
LSRTSATGGRLDQGPLVVRSFPLSRALRHRTTKTTETFYARIRADDAFHEIEKALARPVRIERRTNLAENGIVTET